MELTKYQNWYLRRGEFLYQIVARDLAIEMTEEIGFLDCPDWLENRVEMG